MRACLDDLVIALNVTIDELLDRQPWRIRIELANALFDYLELFHNCTSTAH